MKCETCKKKIKENDLDIVLIYGYSPLDLTHGTGKYHFCKKKCLKEWFE